MGIRSIFSRLLVYVIIASLIFSSVAPMTYAQEGGPVWLPFVGSGYTPAPGADLLFRTRVRVDTPAAWRDLERLAPLFLERGDDWALLLWTTNSRRPWPDCATDPRSWMSLWHWPRCERTVGWASLIPAHNASC